MVVHRRQVALLLAAISHDSYVHSYNVGQQAPSVESTRAPLTSSAGSESGGYGFDSAVFESAAVKELRRQLTVEKSQRIKNYSKLRMVQGMIEEQIRLDIKIANFEEVNDSSPHCHTPNQK
jgi:hypothetical protein